MSTNYNLDLDEIGSVIRENNIKLDDIAISNNDISNEIDGFVSTSVNILVGDAWINVIDDLGIYADYIEVSDDLEKLLIEAQNKISKIVSEFLYPDLNLNTSLLPELEEEKKSLLIRKESYLKSIDELSKVPEYRVARKKDGNGNPVIISEPNEPEYTNARNAMREYNRTIEISIDPRIEEVNRLINKINDVYNVLIPMINEILEEVQTKIEKFIKAIDLLGDTNPKLLRRYLAEGLNDSSSAAFYFDEDGKPYAVYYTNSHIYVSYLPDGTEKFERWNPETGEFSSITIFDEENIDSAQYGANQMSFEWYFDNLINDPDIWDEMQKYYPISSFDSYDDAMDFYERYFRVITNSGCGYAAGTNVIFLEYEGRETEFEKTFGFPMYTVATDGSIDFNYELMELRYYNYSFGGEGYTIEELENGLDISNNIEDFFNTNAVSTSCELSNLDDFLETYGVDCSATEDWYNSFTFFNTDENINNSIHKNYDNNDYFVYAGSGWDLYDMDLNLTHENGGGHYMLVVGFTHDNYPIVSSWGLKMILDPDSMSTDAGVYRYDYINFN